MCFSSPSSPSPVNVTSRPTIVTRQPRLADEGVRKATDSTKDFARRLAGLRGGTLVTGAGGLSTEANTQKKTLLGA